MLNNSKVTRIGGIVIFTISVLIFLSVIVLRSIMPELFPNYFIYIFLAICVFYLFMQIDFDIFLIFSPHLYFVSLLFLMTPLLIGQVTRGAIRWIPVGSITIQPSELVRPFLLMYFVKFLTEKELDIKRLLGLTLIVVFPVFLILIQPSLGVAVLTGFSFLGALFTSRVDKKYFFVGALMLLILLPLFWVILAPYQKQRILTFLDPQSDRYGAGYNSIQSMIAVGSGKFFGRGLGEGIQTQLQFLPEKHTDFIFAAISEEMGFLGCLLALACLFSVFWMLIKIIEKTESQPARAYVGGVFFVLFTETLIHVGMNMGLLPITGVPLPFVSAGGSALLGTAMSVAIAINAERKNK